MNHYPHHIGDYLKDTAHLTMIEDGAYRRLIDLYYQHEQPLPADKRQVYRLARAVTPAERKAVDTILSEYFTTAPDGHRHKRCDEEIEQYQALNEDSKEKKENEKERQRRHRQRRKELFAALRGYDIVPPWDAKTTELETLLSQCQERPVTRDSNAPVTRTDTANQYPIPNTHITTDKSLSPTPVPETPGEHPANTDESDPPASPYGLLCKTLRHAGVQVQPGNPDFRAWVDAGLTEDEAMAAVDIARATKPAPEPIPWAYLTKVLETQRQRATAAKPAAGASQESDPLAWASTWSGIVAKGAELGIEQQPGEIPPDFKARVHAAAGLTAADKSRLLADYGVRA
ncbi:YdaU family protein [Kerstersia gyiorum]|uniref:YdaU family protein n=1 Tax=Kerstersia gyiorum TaxID=206506 RepID=UPI00209D97DA|nr:YdaU family protein [Kerstersia gyiorum]MCP1679427.1 uncharacterized protein YdaU (DUF1376 family) [Kerstersia gyiorum]MCP1823930.1 uncharacterized protein YdaU (DUF1376 family) [Kerstersia gyiorum]MCP1827371.1 uncharacterized protein YdaU (DUF1376 family) [Kerstersia gyiorum]MCW2448980.1 uncharacterized protein YdaU (DUF1376 family) [Kerstersia gyiorum]